MIVIELGNTKDIGYLVATSTFSAVDEKIGIKPVSLLHSHFSVKQAQIELSWDIAGGTGTGGWVRAAGSWLMDVRWVAAAGDCAGPAYAPLC